MDKSSSVLWKFQRLGGLDQVTLRGAEEIAGLRALDPKLWAALSCPASGLEFDARTLALLDTDNDGRIRVPEVLEAVDWVCARLADPAALAVPDGNMPLDLIREDTEEGRRVLAAAKALLRDLGREGHRFLGRADVERAMAERADHSLNGDGVLPPLEAFGPQVAAFIRDALAVKGGVQDAGGAPGVNRDIAQAFMRDVRAFDAWRAGVEKAAGPLGPDAAPAWEAVLALRDKIDDYFLRCDLAAFAPERAGAFAEATEAACDEARNQDTGLLDRARLAVLPLARIEADRPLNLVSGLNPAWREEVRRFASLVRPWLKREDELDKEDWQKVQASYAAYAEALAARPEPESVEVGLPPSASVESLGPERIRELLDGEAEREFLELAEKDLSLPGTEELAECERLLLYYLHLHRLLMNFVSFYDFYSMRRKAAFQAGTLYLDGRACLLCLPVTDKEAHAALASYSQLCLVYCDCRRRTGQGAQPESMGIVAAVTAGDADLLVPGRNGVYVDNMGEDWDATVVKVVSNPIGIREALWQPYKRFGRMVSEQIAKFAGARQAEAQARMEARAAGMAVQAQSGAAAQPFDIGRNVGIFAAIGLALGAIGTAVAGLASALFALHWWQYPLLLLGLFLVISGPSCVMAWLKLRKRNLGPLLEASGWAVNKRLPINLVLGGALTGIAALPPNAARSYRDPLQKPARWPWVLAALLALLLAGGAWLWHNRENVDLGAVREVLKEAVTVPEPKGQGALANATAKEAATPSGQSNATAGEAPAPGE